MYIGDYLARRELYSPDRTAIIDTGKSPEWRLTFRQMNERANRLANWLRDTAGVGRGDRVAILAHDGVEHLDTFFACGKLGAIHTALNWRLHPQELAGIVAQTTPRVLVFSDDVRDKVVQLRALLSGQPHDIGWMVVLGDGDELPDYERFERVLRGAPAEPVATDELEAEDIAALIFTGGTTGLPKAAQVSHRMIGWNTLNTVIHDVTHDDVYLNVFPMFHTGGLFVYTLPQIIFGGTTILMRPFDPPRVLELIERERVTIFGAVPTMYQLIAQAPNWPAADLSS
ncbi:AMP-binding protein, partial [Promineifilum sp.]|uniref:AMP-binding protein n=1 Tax=Promineifilum sp. TaxID=2664178 RepID=UPI0035B12501